MFAIPVAPSPDSPLRWQWLDLPGRPGAAVFLNLYKSFFLAAASRSDLAHHSPGENNLSHEEGEESEPGMMY